MSGSRRKLPTLRYLPTGREGELRIWSGHCLPPLLLLAALLAIVFCAKEERTNPLDSKGVHAGSDPFGLTAVEIDDGVELTWQVPARPAIAGLQILRREGVSGEFVILATGLPRSTQRHVDQCFPRAGKHAYKILAIDAEGRTSSESLAEAVEVTVAVASAPGTPSSASAVGDCCSITVSWTRVTNATGYRVYRDSDTNLVRTLINGSTVTWQDEDPPAGRPRYWVSAVIGNCEGGKKGPTTADRALPCPVMIRVSAGTFTMGGDGAAHCGTNRRPVTLTGDFWLGKYEVTNAEYAEMLQWAYNQSPRRVSVSGNVVGDNAGNRVGLLIMGDTGCEIRFNNDVFTVNTGKQNYPVVQVTWYGAAAFCNWLSLKEGLTPAYNHTTWSCNNGSPYTAEGYRLPTDAEWEYAARYGDGRIYPWGNATPTCSMANYGGCGGITAVGSCPSGVSSLGFLDLAGNVWEWCNDWHQCDLGTSSVQDPPGPGSGSTRVLRGGSWADTAGNLRCAYRNSGHPRSRGSYAGFRCARTGTPCPLTP